MKMNVLIMALLTSLECIFISFIDLKTSKMFHHFHHFLLIYFSETIKVFDGNCSLRRRIFRAITVPRTCNLEQLLTTALRAFHIAREPNVSFNNKIDL